MAMPDRVGPETGPDAVEQARAWLARQTGQRGHSCQPAHSAGSWTGSREHDRDGSIRSSPPARAADPAVAEGPGSSVAGRHDAGHESAEPRNDGPDEVGPDDGGRLGRSAPDDPDADREMVARTIALRKLTAQARTRHELDQALRRENVPDEVATSVLNRLEAVGLVDDESFAQQWVESRQRRRHLSRSALRRELQVKGVDRDHVDAALAGVDTGDELAAARALVAKRAGATRGLDPLVRRRRLAAALARRGFGSGIVAAVLDELGDGPADDTGA